MSSELILISNPWGRVQWETVNMRRDSVNRKHRTDQKEETHVSVITLSCCSLKTFLDFMDRCAWR